MKITRPEDVGGLIKGYRQEHGLSQSALAKRLQTSQKWISQIENGKPTAHFGLVLRALNELGFAVSIDKKASEPASAEKKRRPKFSIDDVVDG